MIYAKATLGKFDWNMILDTFDIENNLIILFTQRTLLKKKKIFRRKIQILFKCTCHILEIKFPFYLRAAKSPIEFGQQLRNWISDKFSLRFYF